MKLLSVCTLIAMGLSLAACKNESATARLPVKPAEQTIVDGSLMTPGTPQLTPPDTKTKIAVSDRTYPLEWNMWWGENGRNWAVYVDGVKVSSGKLPIKSPQAQQGKVEIDLDRPGTHEIKVALCNDHGCTESKPMQLDVAAG